MIYPHDWNNVTCEIKKELHDTHKLENGEVPLYPCSSKFYFFLNMKFPEAVNKMLNSDTRITSVPHKKSF